MSAVVSKHRLIVAGGGTGGHVLAGVAIADAWKERFGADSQVVFVGAHGGIEERLVPRAGYPLELLSLGALKRVGLVKTLKTLVQLPISLIRSSLILARVRPVGVIGVGGYASGPVVLMARFLGPFIGSPRTAILEQNAVPGLTNRILGRFVHHVLSAFPGGDVIVTGNPVRSTIRPMPSAPRDPYTIFIFGGSQGAVGINTLVLDSLAELGDLKGRLRFIHQTGEKDWQRVVDGYEKAGFTARVEKFIYDMPSAYAEASLLICRAGSSTLAEVAAVGRASVLIPFPYASDNHQEKNARIFVDAGAARLLVQFQSKGSDLARIIREMVEKPSQLEAMEKSAGTFYKPDAAKDVVSILRC